MVNVDDPSVPAEIGGRTSKSTPVVSGSSHRIYCGTVDENYHVPRFKVAPNTRPTEKIFMEAGFLLYDGHDDNVPLNCFLSDYQAARLIHNNEHSHVTHPADFTADGKIRASRTNKGTAAKVLIKGRWFYREHDGYTFFCMSLPIQTDSEQKCSISIMPSGPS